MDIDAYGKGHYLSIMNVNISIQDLSIKFRLYTNVAPDLKTNVINWITRKNQDNKYTDFYALKNINLNFQEGERIGIIGLNGAGKSTLFKALSGIYPPTTGSISITGNLVSLLELGTGFDFELSGRENIYLNGAIFGYKPELMKSYEQEIIEFSELGHYIDTPIKYYSNGMISRLAFSIASTVTPEILLLDEVFAVGDAHFVSKATNRINQLLDTSKIFMIITHQTEQILEYCNRVIILHHGEIIKDGPPKENIAYYLKEIVAREG